MPGWLHPGALDDPMAPANYSDNRGCFDAIGVPYLFGVYGPDGTTLIDVCRRILQTTGYLSPYADQQFVNDLIATEGPEKAQRIFQDIYNWQFCTRRNLQSATGAQGGFFWFGSQREHPKWAGKLYTIQANEYLPPGALFAEPPSEPPVAGRPTILQGDDLRRWSMYPRTAPSSVDSPTPYNVWQSYDAADGSTIDQPADLYRSGVFPFPEVVLWGCSPENLMQRVFLRPLQP